MANQKVGSVYEVGLADVGYMLADSPQRPVHRQTGVLDAQPPGSDDPLSERIGRYDFIGASDWTGGEGQEMADRPTSDTTRYFYSEYLFPFNPGQLSCIDGSTQHISSDYLSLALSTHARAVVADGSVYLQTANGQLTALDVPGGTPTAFSTGLAGTISGMASDGEYWYATDGATIRRNNTAADPAADWSTFDVTEIAWCADRLLGISNAVDPPGVAHFAPDGTATGTGATPGAGGYTLRGLCGGDGFVWFGANKGSGGYVRYWQVDSSPTNAGVALVLPTNETVDSLFFYLGNVFLSTSVVAGSDSSRKLYRCVNSDGLLTPQLVLEIIAIEASLTPARTWFSGNDKYVFFAWPLMIGLKAGLGIIDLETGGYARHRSPGLNITNIGAVVTWHGSSGIVLENTVSTGGFYGVDDPVDALVAGYLETSVSDLGTPALKHLDEIVVTSQPLAAGESIAVAYSIDSGATYTTAATFDTDGDAQHSIELATSVVSAAFQFKITLTPGSGVGPVVTGLVAKTHMTGIVDEIIELPINCEDYIADVNNTNIAEDSGPGKGMARYRALQALTGTKVEFQDVDWKVTGETSLVEVIAVESTSVQVFNQNRNVNDVTAHVAVVTLRRPFSA